MINDTFDIDFYINLILLAVALCAFAVMFVLCAKEKWSRDMSKVDDAIKHLNIKV